MDRSFFQQIYQQSKKRPLILTILFVFLGLIGLIIFFLKEVPSTSFTRKQQTYLSSPLIQKISRLVEKEYVEPPDLHRMNEGVLNGMLTALDPYSSYMNEENYGYFLQSAQGEFGGVGMEIMHTDLGIRVITPLDETPAARAGIQPGDLITHVNEEAISNLGYGEILRKIQGKPGTQVTFKILRSEQDSVQVTLTREMIRIHSVRVYRENNIIYVRLSYFHDKTGSDLKERLEKEIAASSEGVPLGIILDVRNNPGGLLEQAIAVSSLFVGQKEVVHVKSRDPRQTKTYSGKSAAIVEGKIPMITLINGGSASAAEILAAALKDHKRSILMGKRTVGKGSVQTLFSLQGEGAVRLTTAKFVSPLNHEIHGKGVQPDIVVDHLENVQRRIEGQTIYKKKGIPCDQDPMLQRAVDMLKGIGFWSGVTKP